VIVERLVKFFKRFWKSLHGGSLELLEVSKRRSFRSLPST